MYVLGGGLHMCVIHAHVCEAIPPVLKYYFVQIIYLMGKLVIKCTYWEGYLAS